MQRVFDVLKAHNAKNVAIFSHIRGDGDCLGAQTGLAEILTSAGLSVVLYNQENLSDNFSFLPHFQEIKTCDAKSPKPDICIAVDCATMERIGELPETFLTCPWINIDHHVSNDGFGILNIVEDTASSTCEMLSHMAFNADILLNAQAATSFYTGISTDTGSFLYSNATAQSFYIAGKLLENGANKNLVQTYIFENTSRKKVDILKHLYGHLHYLLDDAVAYCAFSQKDLAALHASTLDLEGIVSLIKEIQGVELAILFTEQDDARCKISLRSREWFDANRCCRVFGGGGHVRAAGATLTLPFAEAVDTVLREVRQEWKEGEDVE